MKQIPSLAVFAAVILLAGTFGAGRVALAEQAADAESALPLEELRKVEIFACGPTPMLRVLSMAFCAAAMTSSSVPPSAALAPPTFHIRTSPATPRRRPA